MSIKDQLTADMKQAMKDRESGKLRLNVIRMVRANIKNVEINDKKELTPKRLLPEMLLRKRAASTKESSNTALLPLPLQLSWWLSWCLLTLS